MSMHLIYKHFSSPIRTNLTLALINRTGTRLHATTLHSVLYAIKIYWVGSFMIWMRFNTPNTAIVCIGVVYMYTPLHFSATFWLWLCNFPTQHSWSRIKFSEKIAFNIRELAERHFFLIRATTNCNAYCFLTKHHIQQMPTLTGFLLQTMWMVSLWPMCSF